VIRTDEFGDSKLLFRLEIENNSTDSLCYCLPEVTVFTNKYGLMHRASSASGTERSLRPAADPESPTIELAGFTSPQARGPLTGIELGDTLSPRPAV